MTGADLEEAFPGYTQFATLGVQSGQKEVFSAQHGTQRVAVKLFKKIPREEARVERELAAVTKLRSAYVPTIHRSGRVTLDGEERFFLVEDFIEGKPYADILAQEPRQPLGRVLEIADTLLTACCDFSKERLAHRDLKPANLIVDKNGKLWIIDFGLVRHLDLTKVTPTGYGVGTVGYAPIEQWRIIDADVDSRADLFAIGVIVYEALHGGNPWREKAQDARNNLEVIDKMKTEELIPLQIAGDPDGKLSGFIQWLTQRFPSRRPQTATEAFAEFQLIRADLK
jgi:serine/threonine protein kinase